MTASDLEVLAANEAFYGAFAQTDLATMDRLWAQRAPVACIHPGWGPIIGRDQVMQSFQALFERGGARVACFDASAYLFGDSAYVICVELVGDTRLIATNVFTREDRQWRLVHHQSGAFAASFPELGRRAQAIN